jgi:hypothetical protein
MGLASIFFIAGKTLRRLKGFLFRQKYNYRVALIRSSISTFLVNLTAQYDSIYASAPLGWMMDRYSL